MGNNKKTVRIIDREEYNKYNEEVVRIINEEYCDIQVEAEFLGDENGDGIKILFSDGFSSMFDKERLLKFIRSRYKPGTAAKYLVGGARGEREERYFEETIGDFDKAKDHLFFLNFWSADRNIFLWKDSFPLMKEFLDMLLVPYFSAPYDSIFGSRFKEITWEDLTKWNVSKEEVFKAAEYNTCYGARVLDTETENVFRMTSEVPAPILEKVAFLNRDVLLQFMEEKNVGGVYIAVDGYKCLLFPADSSVPNSDVAGNIKEELLSDSTQLSVFFFDGSQYSII